MKHEMNYVNAWEKERAEVSVHSRFNVFGVPLLLQLIKDQVCNI